MLASSLLCPSSLTPPHTRLLTFVSRQHWQHVCLCTSMPVIRSKVVHILHSAATSLSLNIPRTSHSIKHVNYFRLPAFFITYPFHGWPTVTGLKEHCAEETLYIPPNTAIYQKAKICNLYSHYVLFYVTYSSYIYPIIFR